MSQENAKKVLAWMDENRDRLLDLTAELIAVRSISGQPGANVEYEKMVDILKKAFEGTGADVRSYADTAKGGGANTVATYKGQGGGKTVAMGGHYDIVSAEEPDWKTDPYEAVIKDGKLFGRASADMKGGLASCVFAVQALAACGLRPAGDIQVVATVDEEIGSPHGMDYLVRSDVVKPDYFINAEQTEMDIIVAYKGCFWAEVTVRGVSAHGSTPDKGVNAIEKAMDLIQLLRERGLKHDVDRFLGKCTVNIGTIQAGTSANVVPDLCKFVVDVRLVPGQTFDSALEEIRQMIAELKAKDPTFDASIEFCSRCTNAVSLPEDSALVIALRKSSKEVTGSESDLKSFISAGDNCLFHKMGIPSLMMGPGSLDHIHKANEFVLVEDLLDAAKVYALTALELAQ